MQLSQVPYEFTMALHKSWHKSTRAHLAAAKNSPPDLSFIMMSGTLVAQHGVMFLLFSLGSCSSLILLTFLTVVKGHFLAGYPKGENSEALRVSIQDTAFFFVTIPA